MAKEKPTEYCSFFDPTLGECRIRTIAPEISQKLRRDTPREVVELFARLADTRNPIPTFAQISLRKNDNGSQVLNCRAANRNGGDPRRIARLQDRECDLSLTVKAIQEQYQK